MAGSAIRIFRVGRERPIRFAADELSRYLKRMTGRSVPIAEAASYNPSSKAIWVGLADVFGDVVPSHLARREHPFDDAIFVRAEGRQAIVSGANPRSVVFAGYRYLEELGCRWLRPGRDGERVPRLSDPLAKRIRIGEAPKYRHRCICIEGSCSESHVRAMIGYAAKRGFNSYFLQFFNSYDFFKRWYSRERHRGEKETEFTQEEASRICERVKDELHRRGMVVHRVGHGWTCGALGIVANQFGPIEERIRPSLKKYFALVNGKRELWWNSPIFTQLCYSNPRVRMLMARAVAEYAETHPDEEVLHVWLADAANNYCECTECSKARPSDFYVMILNEIDELLTRKNLPTRIVFLAYVDLLWAPQKQRFKNPDRFILMFAPITRSYTTSFLEDTRQSEKVGPYLRNKLAFPKSPKANLGMLEGWRKMFKGDCVDFDYHLWREPHNDPGQAALAEVLFRDVRDLDKLGMDGFISCQIMRVFFPTGLYMHVMGKGLWNPPEDYEKMVGEYFTDLFAKDSSAVKEFLEQVTKLFDPPLLRGEKPRARSWKQAAKRLGEVPGLVRSFMPVIGKGRRSADPVSAAQWEMLREHAWYASLLGELYSAIYSGDGGRAVDLYMRYDRQLDRRLPGIHQVLDVASAKVHMRQVLAGHKISFAGRFVIGEQ